MKIVSFKICPFVQRVIGVLELKGVDYEVEYISLADKPDWFLKVSPHGQVPILMTDEGVLFESEPIAEYIDEIYDDTNLHPKDPFLKAQNRAWVSLASRNYLVQCHTQRSSTSHELEENLEKLGEVFRKVEIAKMDGSYFNGDNISQVDVAWFVILYRTHLVYECTNIDFLADYSILREWRGNLLKVESLRKSAPKGFEDEFSNFYLNENTYLGGVMRSNAGGCGSADAACCDAETLTLCCR
jgi:glutathione S-transferase